MVLQGGDVSDPRMLRGPWGRPRAAETCAEALRCEWGDVWLDKNEGCCGRRLTALRKGAQGQIT